MYIERLCNEEYSSPAKVIYYFSAIYRSDTVSHTGAENIRDVMHLYKNIASSGLDKAK